MFQGFHNIIWPQEPSDTFLHMLHEHNMWNGINFYNVHDTYVELWTFSTESNKFLDPRVYLDIQEYLKHFIVFFNSNFFKVLFKKMN